MIKIGFDFDGVVAYNPFRIVRFPLTFFKQTLLGQKKLRFWYPEKRWQQIFWIILHHSSIFPAKGMHLFKHLVDEGHIEAHLVTARYSFLDDHLYNWLDMHKLRNYFSTINMNKKDEQPHIFKDKVVEKLKLDYFIEDNLDIVKYLQEKSQPKADRPLDKKVKIYWIYNIFDRNFRHPHKFPYLEKALEDIMDRSKIKDQRSKPSSKLKSK